VKSFTTIERALRTQISEIEAKDRSLVDKIENALCFGKVMFTVGPAIIREFGML